MNNPADTLAALADKLETQAGRRVPKWTDRPTQSPPMRYRYDDDTRAFMAGIAADLRALASLKGEAVPKRCDGKEQEAFEAWAAAQKYDMERHPLHWLFLNERTYAARQGWAAALEYANKIVTTPPAPQAAERARADKLCANTTECSTPRLCASVGTCKGKFVLPAIMRAAFDVATQPQQAPSPAPQGGGEAGRCQHQHTVTVNGPSAATSSGIGCLVTGGRCLPGSCAECPATPPAQQPGEVEPLRTALAECLDAMNTHVAMYPHMDKAFMVDARKTAADAIAPKENGNG